MNLSSLLEAALRTLLVALAVGAGLRLLRVSNVLAQKKAWCLVLAAAIAMPLLMRWQWLSSSAPIRVPAPFSEQSANSQPAETARAPISVPAQTALPNSDLAPLPAVYSVTPDAASSAGSASANLAQTKPRTIRIATLLWLFYFGAGVLLLARLLYGLIATARLWITAEPVCLGADCDLAAGMRLRSSRRIVSPVALASGVVLPAKYLEWDRQKLRIVLAHERAHLRQGDFYLQILAGLHAALFWFSPLSWWLKRKLSDLGEAVSDRAGLEAAASRSSYAQILLEFAALPRPALRPYPLGVAMTSHTSSLSDRIERFLDESRFHQAFAGSRRRALLAVLLVPAAIFAFTALIRVEAASQPAIALQEAQTTGQSTPEIAPPPPPPPTGNQGITVNNSGSGFFCASTSSGEWYAVVTDPKTNVKFNGEASDVLNRELAKATRKEQGKFLWFTHEGRPYVIEDRAMVARMESIVKRNEAIVKSLGSSQEAKRLGLHVEDGEDGNLLVTGVSLGELLSKLGEEGGRVAEEWGKLGSEADSKMRAIIDESLRDGKAHPDLSPDSSPYMAMMPPDPPPPPPTAENSHHMSFGPGYSYSVNGDSYALVTGPSNRISYSGDWDRKTWVEIDKARKQAHGEFLWFKQNGKPYFLDDPAVVAQIEAMDKPMEALGKQQEELGRQMKEVGKQMEEVGRKMKEATIPTPDMSKEIDNLEKQMAKLRDKQGKTMTTEEWAEMESKLGNLQGKLGAIQGEIGAKQGAFGGEMGKLGGQMGELGGQQGRLGAEQGRLAEEADRKIKAIIDKALKEGKARPIE